MKTEKANVIKYLKGIFYGLVYGAASPIPGISGGTLAVFANIYEDFFSSASLATARKNIPFLITFTIGCTLGLFGISHVMTFLLDNYGQIMYFSFIGLIVGCVPMVFTKAKSDKFKVRDIIILIIAFGLMIFLAFAGGDLSTNSSLEQLGGLSPGLLAWLFFASFISSVAMLIPGLGGSIMMLAFGIYVIYIEALSGLDFFLISVLGFAMLLGLAAGILLIKKLLASFSQTLYCAILGFITGSIFIIYPGFSFDLNGLLSIIFALGFSVLAFCLSRKS